MSQESINPFGNEDKTFESVEEYLDRLKADLEEKGYDIEWGDEIENEDAVEVIYEGSVLEDLRVPTNLDVINRQVGPINGYDVMLDTIESALYYDENEGDLPFLGN